MYVYVGNDPVNAVDPTGTYGRLKGWKDKDWKKFDTAQKEAAADMSEEAGNLRRSAEQLADGDVDSEGYSASELNSMADRLDAGVSALMDDGSNGYWAKSGDSNDTGGDFGSAPVGGKSVTVNVTHPGFSSQSSTRWMAGHESLHSAGLEDQYGFNGYRAYKIGLLEQERLAFRRLMKSRRFKNPDHIMSRVYP
ncbi:MAG: hypothetical protein WBN06_03165, partial [Lysobacterales bacterium]